MKLTISVNDCANKNFHVFCGKYCLSGFKVYVFAEDEIAVCKQLHPKQIKFSAKMEESEN